MDFKTRNEREKEMYFDYFDYFFSICYEMPTSVSAYLNTEAYFLEKYGFNKYSSYRSFRNAKSKYIKRIQDGIYTKKRHR